MRRTKSYFASDFHLGAPSYQSSRDRELKIVAWLDFIKADAAEVFLMGDVFDFWFEYATVIPKGFIRLQGKLAELSDAGIKIYFFKGNHDMWVFDYFKKELGAIIVSDELILERDGKRIFMHHGDGLGSGDTGYKLLKNFFRSNFCQWLFARLHPNFGIGIANYWSSKSRLANSKKEGNQQVEYEKNWINAFYLEFTKKYGTVDYLILGHRHFPITVNLEGNAVYINLGEWVNFATYAVFDSQSVKLLNFDTNEKIG
ncbi:UDP-2,3-diacylglucosamine diphosphatase [Pedobacter cryophilus]|uniref:UDP-2,3-diacylglucosamine diphosphatase n=1 Tax=Pedobacter cryophilus TaxID=2571271 RepID=A0A4U1C8E7_9SPHI|nr:UDP-2,3-diacylglucosamine diphosphatase [Pedobacter cryophilus]TKC00964.1 UDP-2,3-diacylglucosamine diphosphatase [Pedobacter cryophilus]